MLATQDHCGICGATVDKSIPYRNRDGDINPDTAVVDHVKPLARGGNPLALSNLALAHWRCNASKGAGQRTARATSRRL